MSATTTTRRHGVARPEDVDDKTKEERYQRKMRRRLEGSILLD